MHIYIYIYLSLYIYIDAVYVGVTWEGKEPGNYDLGFRVEGLRCESGPWAVGSILFSIYIPI